MTGGASTSTTGGALYTTPDLTAVGYLANLARERRSGDRTYFVRNLHINYTNICNKLCKFCSFYTAPNSQDGRGYVLSPEEAAARVAQYALGADPGDPHGGRHQSEAAVLATTWTCCGR
ncbi:MAG: hypothetical protein MZW92_38615 [Comamonadaceae bacterium]|nr:hypothetical protein [Comamonadaceae bacterium]